MTTAIAGAIGISAALLVAALLAVTAGARGTASSIARERGGPLTIFTAGFAYLVVLLPVVTSGGLNLAMLLLLICAVILPALVALGTRGMRARLAPRGAAIFDSVGLVIAFALLIGQLAVAGAVLSLLGDVNRIFATAAVGIACACYLLARGRAGAARTSRWAIGPAALAVLVLAIGFVVGTPGTLTVPLVPSEPLPALAGLALLLGTAAAGVFDPVLHLTLRDSARPGRAVVIGIVVLAGFMLVCGVGALLIFGGAMEAPSLQFLTVFAVFPAAGVGILMVIVTFLLASTTDSLLAAAADVSAERVVPARDRIVTVILAAAAVIIAVLAPDPVAALALGSIICAAGAGGLLPGLRTAAGPQHLWPGVVAGLAAAISEAVFLGFTTTLAFTGATAAAIVTAAVVAAVVSVIVAAVARSPKPLPSA